MRKRVEPSFVMSRIIGGARTSAHGCRPTSPTQRPTKHNCNKEIYQSSFRTYEKTRLARRALSRCSQGSAGAEAKKDDGADMASPRDPTTRHVDGQNLKVKFLDGQLIVMDGSARRSHP